MPGSAAVLQVLNVAYFFKGVCIILPPYVFVIKRLKWNIGILILYLSRYIHASEISKQITSELETKHLNIVLSYK